MQGKLQGKEEGEVEKKQASLTSASVKRVLLSLTPHTSFCLGILTDSTDFDVKTHTQLNTGCEEERRERKQKEAQTYESSQQPSDVSGPHAQIPETLSLDLSRSLDMR